MEKSIWNNVSPLPEMDLHRIYFLLFISITQYLFHLYLTLFSIVLFLSVWFIHYSDVQHSWTYPRNGMVHWIKFSCWFLSFLVAQTVKESACSARDLGSIPGLGKSPGEGTGYPLQPSCLENSWEGGAWQATVHGVTESDMTEQLSHSRKWLLKKAQL